MLKLSRWLSRVSACVLCSSRVRQFYLKIFFSLVDSKILSNKYYYLFFEYIYLTVARKINNFLFAHFKFMNKLHYFFIFLSFDFFLQGMFRMCEVFCSFNVTFYAWMMKNIDKQTNDERFVLRIQWAVLYLLFLLACFIAHAQQRNIQLKSCKIWLQSKKWWR